MSNPTWKALYYPYADFRDPSFVLRAALFYDELYFLQRGFFKAPKYLSEVREDDGEAWPEVSAELMPLYERKILREVDSDFLGITRGWMPGLNHQVEDSENHEI